jgi:hypothetical protein
MSKRMLAVLAAAVLGLGLAAAAIAVSSSDVQANAPQVAGDATSDDSAHFPTNKQNEPSIAVNPLNSSFLIAGSNDEQTQPQCGADRGGTTPNDCSFAPNVGTDGVYTSSDGGSTWVNRGLLRGFSDYGDGGKYVSDGDPVIVYGPKPAGSGFSYDAAAGGGVRAYYAGLASYASGAAKGNQAPELLTVSRSDDNGATWTAPVVAASANGYTFNDKEAIWADRNPASPNFGRVYISWTQFRGIPGCAEPVMFEYSTDGGTTWSKPNQITPARNCGFGGRQGSTIRTDKNGNVYLVWEDSDKAGSVIAFAVSRDGGRTFSKPATVSSVTDIADPIPGSNFRTDSFPSVGIDQTNGNVYVAFATAASGTGQIVVARSTDGGQSWSNSAPLSAGGYAFFQGLDVSPGGRVDVGWQEQRSTSATTYGKGNASIDSYYSKSTDGGATFSAPTKVTSASSDPAASAQNDLQRQFWGDYNTLVSVNGQAWFIYTDSRGGVGCTAVDAYQHGIDGTGPVVSKPAPLTACPDVGSKEFGNTDVYVSKITP